MYGQLGGRKPITPGQMTSAPPAQMLQPGVSAPLARKGAPQGAIGQRFNRGPGAGTGANPNGVTDNDNARFQEDALYQDILKSHANAWSGIEQGQNANAAQLQRRNAAMNAAMGRSVGGGFASGMQQAFLTGQQQLNAARLQHEQQGRNLQLDWLDRMVRRRQRDEDLDERAALAESGVPGGGVPTAQGTYTSNGKVYAT